MGETLRDRYERVKADAWEALKQQKDRPTPAGIRETLAKTSEVVELREQLARAEEDEKAIRELNELGGRQPIPTGDGGGRLGASLKTLHRAASGGQVAAVEVPTKDLLTPVIPPTRVLPVVAGDYPANLVDLSSAWRAQRMDGPSMRVYRVTNVATAAVVAEGAEKPLSGLATDHLDLEAQKWAVRETLTSEALSDFPTLADVVQSELAQALRAAINGYIVGTAAAADGALAISDPSLLDGVSKAKAQLLALTGRPPSQVWVNPDDLADAEQAKAAGSGEYFLPPLSPSPTGIHDVPVRSTPAVTKGTWLAGSFETAGVMGWRETASVQVGYGTGDFETNKRSVVVEARGVLGIVRANHLAVGTITG